MAYAGKTLFASCEEGFVRAVYTFLTYIAKICNIKYNRTRELGGTAAVAGGSGIDKDSAKGRPP
jgi:hypothetical protein